MTGGGLVGVGGPAGRLRSAGFHCAQQLIRHQRHVRRLISLPLCLGQPTTPKMYAFSSNIYLCISHRPRPYPSVSDHVSLQQAAGLRCPPVQQKQGNAGITDRVDRQPVRTTDLELAKSLSL